MAKRQVGVLARTGALPQGKRSVEALARNGELPVHNHNKRDSGNDYILDLLIQELAAAEGLSRLHLQALTERLLQQREDGMEQENSFEDMDKRSLSSLARTGGFPSKRGGYLVKPAQGASDQQPDLLDPDDFLGKNDLELLAVNGGLYVADDKRGGLASLAKHGYIGKREGEDFNDYLDEYDDMDKRNLGAAKNFLGKRDDEEKRNIGAAKNFLGGGEKRHLGSFRNFGKKNVGAARNFFSDNKRNLASVKNFLSSTGGKRHIGAARNFLSDENKRNIGAAKNFFLSGSKKNLGSARNFFYGKRSLASFARDGGFSSLKYPSSKEYAWDDDEFDFDDFHEDEKRYLGSFLRNQRYLGSLGGRPYTGKRNLASFKNFGKRFEDDEDIAKRYYATLLRQGRQAVDDHDNEDVGELLNEELSTIEKRQVHVNSTGKEILEETKLQGDNKNRTKRDAYISGEYPMPVLQNTKPSDYEDFLAALAEEAEPNDVEKRFLGKSSFL